MVTAARPSTRLESREKRFYARSNAGSSRIGPGDRVSWNGYEGRVLAVNGETAVVVERHNFALGRTVKWRLALDSLVRIPPAAPLLPDSRC